jgi:hypothetical protein
MTTTTMTQSSSAAAAVAATGAAFLKPSVKRIIKGSTCIILGITKESTIKCAGGTNVEERSLKSRVKSASIDLRYYKCGQPWVLEHKTNQCIEIYENRWKDELVDELGYPSRKLHNTSTKI